MKKILMMLMQVFPETQQIRPAYLRRLCTAPHWRDNSLGTADTAWWQVWKEVRYHHLSAAIRQVVWVYRTDYCRWCHTWPYPTLIAPDTARRTVNAWEQEKTLTDESDAPVTTLTVYPPTAVRGHLLTTLKTLVWYWYHITAMNGTISLLRLVPSKCYSGTGRVTLSPIGVAWQITKKWYER